MWCSRGKSPVTIDISERSVFMKMMSAFVALVLAASSSFAHSAKKENAKKIIDLVAIRAVLDAQAGAWNRGDIEGYMDGYDRSSDTVFVSGDRVTRGWQTVLARYKK